MKILMKAAATLFVAIAAFLVYAVIHAAGSASPVGHALPRARTFPSAVFSTLSFR